MAFASNLVKTIHYDANALESGEHSKLKTQSSTSGNMKLLYTVISNILVGISFH